MTCDPNTLSQLSSCLRCLTDAQLMQVKTYLLCKWTQAVAGGGGMIAIPNSMQWNWTNQGSGTMAASIVGGSCPAGADGFQLGAVASPGNPQTNIIGVTACAGTRTTTFNLGDTALGAIRWTLAGVPVSGWSLTKSVVIGNGLLIGLVAYWKFDENGGPAFADATGNGWTGTGQGGIPTTLVGKINNAIVLQNSGTQGVSVSLNIDTRLSNTPFSVSLWFNNQDVGATSKAMIGEWGTRNDYVVFNNAAQLATFRASDDAGVTTDVVSATITPGSYVHVVFGFDGANIFIYTNNGSLATTAKAAVRRGGGVFAIGNYQSFTLGWIGNIDEVGYYNRTLSASDVAQLYNGGAALPFSSFTN